MAFRVGQDLNNCRVFESAGGTLILHGNYTAASFRRQLMAHYR
ncbi:MAG: hypothetical protein ACI835_001009 [Planctomycetota bacterium]|jgi:hypothetical protein